MSDGSATCESSALSVERAWVTFLRRWRGYAFALTRDVTDAEEVIQEAIARTLRARPNLPDETDANRYVRTAVRTAAWRLFEQRRRTPAFSVARLPQAVDVSSDPLRLALAGEYDERRQQLAAVALEMLASLRPDYRQAVELLVLREPPLKLREVAELQGTSVSTIHSRLQAALREIGRALSDAAEAGP